MAALAGDLSRRVSDLLTAAGMPDDDLFREAMVLTVEAAEVARTTAEVAREAVKDGARGLTREGEAELVLRIQQTVERQVADTIDLNASRIAWRIAGGLALKAGAIGIALLVGGVVAGRLTAPDAEARALESSAFAAQLAEMNNMQVLRDHCLKHRVEQKNGTACELPLVWVKPPGK